MSGTISRRVPLDDDEETSRAQSGTRLPESCKAPFLDAPAPHQEPTAGLRRRSPERTRSTRDTATTITATTADRLQTTGRGAFHTAAAITTAPIRGLMAATTSDRVSRKTGIPAAPRARRRRRTHDQADDDDDGGGAPARPDVDHDQGAPPITTPRRRGAATRAAPWTADGTPGGPRRAAAALSSLTRW